MEFPRIWWCPTGALSFLPIHAAGDYRGLEPDTILNYAVSSYTPTITALTSCVANPHCINNEVSGLFLTSQPNGIPASVIGGTTNEVKKIHDTLKSHKIRVLKCERDEITPMECLNKLEKYSSVHFACH